MRYNIVFHPSWWHRNAGIDFSARFFQDPEYRIQADMTMRRVLHERFGCVGLGEADPQPRPIIGSDMLACGYLSSQIMGCPVEFAPDDAPQVLCANLTEEEAFALEVPDFDTNPVWQGIRKQLDWLQEKFGWVDTSVDFNGIQNLAMDLRGQDLFLDYYDEDSPAQHLLEVSYQVTRELCRRFLAYSGCISGGVSNIVKNVMPEVVLHSNCSVEMISQQNYEEWLLPYEIRMAEEFTNYGIHHCGQSMEHVIHGYAKTPNLKMVEVGAFSDLAACVQALPEHVLVNARYSPVRLAQASDEELYDEIKAMTEILPGKRLSVSCVGIDSSVSDERIIRFCSICRELMPD